MICHNNNHNNKTISKAVCTVQNHTKNLLTRWDSVQILATRTP